MKYSAGIKNISFWLLESKLTAEYILDGLSKDDILEMFVKYFSFRRQIGCLRGRLLRA